LTAQPRQRIVQARFDRSFPGSSCAGNGAENQVRYEAIMPVEQWSDSVLLGELADDPQFTDDINQIIDICTETPNTDALLNFANVSYVNSSGIARLLKLRKLVIITNQRRLKLCGINTHVWGVFLVTGLDKIFEFVDDVPSGLAALQLSD
jgi:anti-anti-sigma factor